MLYPVGRWFLILCLGVWSSQISAQQMTFRTISGAKQVVVGSTFDVTFSLENGDGGNFKPPSFSPFKRVAGPSQSYQSTFINGKSSKSSSYSYTLQATKIGKFSINGASMIVGGKTIKSNPIQIEVVKQAANLAPTDEPQIYLRAEVDTNNLFVGQQCVVRYKIYTQVNIENYNIVAESAYDGCFTQVLDAYKERAIKEVIDGVEFTTKVLRKVAIFPQQNGKINIDPLAVRIGIPDPRRKRRSFFSSFNTKSKNLSSNSVELFVRSPYTGAPHNFSGAVGSFQAKYLVHPTQVTTDDAITIRLKIVGNGDTKMIRPPDLELPSHFESYDPKVIDEKMINATDSVRGEKIVEYLVLAKEPGRHIIKPTFTFFDPKKGAFSTVQDSFAIQVKAGKNFGKADNHLRASEGDMLDGPIFSTALHRVRKPVIQTLGYWSAFGIPLLGFIWLAWRSKVQREQSLNVVIDHTAIAHARLLEAKNYLDAKQAKPFFEELALCLKNYLTSKIQIQAADLNKDTIKSAMADAQVGHEAIEQLIAVLDQCDYALYAGIHDPSKMDETYADAVRSVEVLEQEFGLRDENSSEDSDPVN